MHIILVMKRIKDVITYVMPLTKYAGARKYTPITFLIYFLGRRWENKHEFKDSLY